MELSNILSIVALALGSGLAAGRFLWAGDRRSNRDRLMSAEAEAARLQERVAVLLRLAEERAGAITALEGKLDAAVKQANEAAFEVVRLRERESAFNRQLETKTRQSAGMEQQLTAEFENLANRILKANAAELSGSSQRTMAALLDPLRERLQEFQRKVESTYEAESRDVLSLREQISWMAETSQKLGSQADGLARALRGDSQLVGRWGEIALERILEAAGLTEGREFVAQGRGLGLRSAAGGTQRPDIVILLPEQRSMIIDSKVPLASYERLIAAVEEAERTRSADQFVRDLKRHIDDLAGKRYQHHEKLEAHECVLMFVPVEGALSAALARDPDLFFYAWERHVVLVGPPTLLMTLRTVASVWRTEMQGTNAQEIAKLAGELCDKLSESVMDLNVAAEKIAAASEAHSTAMRRLSSGRGNVLALGKRICSLGVQSSKPLPAVVENV